MDNLEQEDYEEDEYSDASGSDGGGEGGKWGAQALKDYDVHLSALKAARLDELVVVGMTGDFAEGVLDDFLDVLPAVKTKVLRFQRSSVQLSDFPLGRPLKHVSTLITLGDPNLDTDTLLGSTPPLFPSLETLIADVKQLGSLEVVDSFPQLAKKLKALALGGEGGNDSAEEIPQFLSKCRKLEHLFLDSSKLDLDLVLISLRSIKTLRFGTHAPMSLLEFAMLFTNPKTPLRNLQRLTVRDDSPFAALRGDGEEAVAARAWWKKVGWESSRLQVGILPARNSDGREKKGAAEDLTVWRPLD
ncbi:hypothetical protein BCR35DRAFT_305669 [Leucosporidium creatinivorum]|uniref:Uncharacterized protein n=1 Tax=Leucosporidium creatinivorum TaxID=106004 RepID=A0A1Y2F0M0_9BASI|nr:hypothetical protein BCR35DRAFT_305669 [Leucosporidium creatinivorum]